MVYKYDPVADATTVSGSTAQSYSQAASSFYYMGVYEPEGFNLWTHKNTIDGETVIDEHRTYSSSYRSSVVTDTYTI